MGKGSLSKRNGVQPDSARSNVLAALAEHHTLDAKQLDKLSPYDSPVWSRLAREMTLPTLMNDDSGCLVKKIFDPKTLKTTYTLTELGQDVLSDIEAYSGDFRRRKAVSHYHRAHAKLRQAMADPSDPRRRWITADIVHSLELGASSFAKEIEREPRQRYLMQVQQFVPEIARLVEAQYAAIHEDADDLSGWCGKIAKYHETLKAESVDSGFTKVFLRKIMIGRLS